MIPFNYHHLFYFHAVARLGSVSAAAAELRVSQPALSVQIRQFEAFLGERLFEREGRKLRLTEAGKTAYAYARDIFETGREFMDGVRDRAQAGRLRIQIGVTNSIPKAFAAALLGFVLKKSPAAHVRLQEDTLESLAAGLENHAFDAVLSDMPYRASEERATENRLIGRVPIVFCGTAAVVSRLGRLPGGLEGAPLLLPTAHSGVYHAVLEYLAAHRVTPNVVAEIQDVELIHRMAIEGAGVAPLSDFAVRASPFRTKLSVLGSARRHDIHDSVYLITRRRKKSHPLVDAIASEFRIPA